MNRSNVKDKIRSFADGVDPILIMFLLLISQERIVIKLVAILLAYVFRFNFKFDFKRNRLPVFYLVIMCYELLQYVFMGSAYLGNWATLVVSSLYWLLSLLALHQVKLSIEKHGTEKIAKTLSIFVFINLFFCIKQLISVMIVTHSINPYSVEVFAPDIHYPEIIFPYGHSSGDLIRGLFYDNHYNAIISQFCFIFFLSQRKFLMAFINLFIITLICFNLVTLLLIGVMGFYFFILKGIKSKLFIVGSCSLILLFYVFVTPENISYLNERIQNSVSSLASNNAGIETTVKINPGDTVKNILHGAKPQSIIDTTYNIDKVSGKKIAYAQTFKFLLSNKEYLIFGCGPGTFSSKLANNFSGVFAGATMLSRNLPAPSFELYHKNHGSLNKFLSKQVIGKHSINNFPNSVYNHLLTEYGAIGCLLFFLFYLLFFLKRYKHLTYGLLLLPLLLIYFNYGYYLETLDIVIFFELLMFLDLKKHTEHTYE